MKRIYHSFLLVAITIFALTGCGNNSSWENEGTEPSPTLDDVITIPDNDPKGILVPTVIDSNVKSIANVKVTLGIEHGRINDLRIYLQSPSGTKIPLSIHNGGNAKSFYPTFVDSADKSISNISEEDEPFNHNYRPEEPLASFNGEVPNGQWSLIIYDDSEGATGTLTRWEVWITGEE